jgi:hypothetical protein
MFSESTLKLLRQLQTKADPMTDLSPSPNTLAMPEIAGVTVPHGGLHYLKPELLLDFISVTSLPLVAITPVAVLYASIGVLQRIDLRKIPVAIKGRVIYPICPHSLPNLRAKLVINGPLKKVKFQGSLIPVTEAQSVKNMALIGVALEFTVRKT